MPSRDGGHRGGGHRQTSATELPGRLRPLRLVPTLSRPPWGGLRLAALGKGEGAIGESWEVWRENSVLHDGRPFGELADFPLLVKLLDTRERLSVQVHPNAEQARLLAGAPHGKAEAWVVLAAEPGARIAYGLNRELTESELRGRAESGEIEHDLAWIEPKPGDVIDVPPGTIHAIGPGLFLYEVQEPIDLTWRLYDWGRGRTLHLTEACAVAIRSPMPPPWRQPVQVCERVQRLIEGPHFVVERVVLPLVRSGWEALTVLEGSANAEGVAAGPGETLVLPPGRWLVEGVGEALVARPR
jgi:mannose-6-phosphate isomerase